MCFMLASREQFNQYLKSDGITDIQRAARFLYITAYSFGARGKTFGTSKSRCIKSAGGIIERINEISKRLDKVLIEHKNALDVIKEYDGENKFFYIDPPYTKGTGYDIISLKDFNHKELAQTIKSIKGRFILSYNDCPEIRELYKELNIIEVSRHKGINNINVKDNIYKELIIRNF